MNLRKRSALLWEKEKKTFSRCLIFVFAAGLACHAAAFFSDMSFYDDVTCTYDVGTTHIFGRFTLALLGKITRMPFGGSNYSLPWFNGLLALVFLGIFAWMCVQLLGIKKALYQLLVCAILVSFPVITSLFAYGFTAPYYLFALPLCAFSAGCFTLRGKFALTEGKKGARNRLFILVGGIVCEALLTGIYQAYLPVLLTLEVCILLKDELCDKEESRQKEQRSVQVKRWICSLFGTLLGFGLYLVLMKISLALTGKELYSYKGLDSLGSGGSSYPVRIFWAFKIFFNPESFAQKRGSTDYLPFVWSMKYVYWVVLALGILFAVLGALWIASKKKYASLIRYAVLTAMFPLVVNFVFVMTDFDVYSLMLYAWVFVFVYLIMMAQIFDEIREKSVREPQPVQREDEKIRPVRKVPSAANMTWIGCLSAGLSVILTAYSVLFYCRYDNLCYYKAGRLQDAAIAYDEVLIMRLQQTEGYDVSLPVCFVNQFDKLTDGWTVDEELLGVELTPYDGGEIINEYSWVSFMRIHCGYDPTVIEDYGQYDTYIEEENMPRYPAQGSIRVVDGVIVVNF